MKKTILTYLKICPPALELFQRLEDVGDIFLIGGVLREYRDYQQIKNLRDVDIIVDVKDAVLWRDILQDYTFMDNRFDGHKLMCQDLLIDIWDIKETWAYRTGHVKCDAEKYVQCLPQTVFLNIDGIFYDWTRETWMDETYRNAMETRILDVILPDNPQLLLNIIRSFVLRERYNMKYSDSLKNIILKEMAGTKNVSSFGHTLYKEQMYRYKKAILSEARILGELEKLVT